MIDRSRMIIKTEYIFSLLIGLILAGSCTTSGEKDSDENKSDRVIKPAVITDTTMTDTDDPAIWIHPNAKDSSLVIGTDKDNENGGLYVFDLKGNIDTARIVLGLKRPNNVDIAYGFSLDGDEIDIAVATERNANRIRVFSLPDMKAIDNGGIEVFEGKEDREPMGIALYKNPSDHAIYAIVSRKKGPEEKYLEQYLLYDNNEGSVAGQLKREFGKYSGKREIESVIVDDELGFVYYSDEKAGVRKYYADPDKGDEELAFFGQSDFERDLEGISIYKVSPSTGYIIVSDQQANRFNVYPREGMKDDPHSHQKIVSVPLDTEFSDGNAITNISLPGFSYGMFVAMSDDKTFHYYDWQEIAEAYDLKMRED